MATDTSVLTALGNDFDFDNVFKRQVEALVRPIDIVWALSVSGSSLNVIRGLQAAKLICHNMIGFTSILGQEMLFY